MNTDHKMEVKTGHKREFSLKRFFRNRNLLLGDIIIVALSYFLTFLLRLDAFESVNYFAKNFGAVSASAMFFVVVLYIFGIYTTMWIHSGTKDYIRAANACVTSSVFSAVASIFIFKLHYKYAICAVVCATLGVVISRMGVRAVYNLYRERMRGEGNRKRLMIVGAGSSASILMKDVFNNENLQYKAVCLVDDAPEKQRATLNGVRVLGKRNDIPSLVRDMSIDEIVIAMPSATPQDRRDVIEICNETGCKVKTLPSIDQIIDDENLHKKLRDVEIEDLLAREPIKLDNNEIGNYITDKTILVTGGGGSIGSELCRQIMKFRPGKLIILDIYENNAYDLQMELNRKFADNKPEVVIASVRDMARIDDIFRKYRPYIVFHAAAHKHVPLMEDSPGEAIKNNVIGTYNVVKCADKYNVKRFVMISTDKAVNPTNVMGATKRICEMIVQAAQKSSETEFVAVRFGNVLGSNGSVIPLFKRQIKEGGPITVTDKRITRFFMTIPEAAQLVLQAASYAKGGEIFVLDMGEPVKIYDLAKNLIRLSGYTPDEDIKIEVCGLRPGEKLYEELLMDEEGLTNTSHNKIFIGKQIEVNEQEIKAMVKELSEAAESDDVEKIKDAVAKAVPTYVRKK